ncbi:MAG: HNH endonuclease [Phycisphaerae bacterium]|nr:HNH endonuclease [Phycisphaerae bacterium]
MRVTYQPSGGRGEYEISETTADGLTPTDLVDHRLIFQLAPDIRIDTDTFLRHIQGKFRIRLKVKNRGIQLQRQLAAALLMPAAVRSGERIGSGLPVMLSRRYIVAHIQLSNVQLTADTALLTVDEVIVANTTHQAEEIGFARRLQNLRSIWTRRLTFPSTIAEIIHDHQAAVMAGGPIPTAVEKAVRDLQTALATQAPDLELSYSERTDPLPPLLHLLGRGQPDQPTVQMEDIDPEETALKRRVAKDWRRWATQRGPTSAQFRNAVRRAYRSTCIVCGKKFPSTPFNRLPGVDAAHILPWAQYDLDVVSNGLCLCKLHHWAFDEGILRIAFRDGSYFADIPDEAEELIDTQRTGFSLDVFRAIVGPIPPDRLPRRRQDRPRPQFLNSLQQLLSDSTQP